MKKVITFFGLILFVLLQLNAQQRTVSELTVNYTVSTNDSLASTSLKGATKVVYIKANDSRVDMFSKAFNQTTFYDKSSGNAVVLREIGNNKIMTKLNKTQWVEKNSNYEGAEVNLFADTKTILGYECKKAEMKGANGNVITLYYATAITPSVKEFEYYFKNVPGLVLEYEVTENNQTIKYTATKISLSPVTASKFDVPVSGYRILN